MARAAPTGQTLLTCVADRGSAAHPWPRHPELLRGEHCARSLADLIHYLCTLHGRYPGVIDHASLRAVDPASRGWFAQATYAFAGERAYLARLAVAAGPVPSTPGAAGTDSTVLAQRHALDMLAQSERNGCALGASLALVLDWAHLREVLDAGARRFGVEPPPYTIAEPGPIADLADAYAGSPAVQRALLFGAEQILHQHHGLWDLLEARHQARAQG
ncbi:hypothetical protein E2493_00480 [Sphingomonas parva]|uniref:Heme oxygenase n=2 Tax=Sphingomonas parva TaxID=2555898 RepID=A0A4Y8ZWF4_9SPHN|nr:hypothetical protein E2493_00480 [Sphingomonas parva]